MSPQRAAAGENGRNWRKATTTRGRCFVTWIEGEGFEPVVDYGQTGDHCYNIGKALVHINDWTPVSPTAS